MKKNLLFSLVALVAAVCFGLVSCSDDGTKLPTYPVEQGSITINGNTYVTPLYQCPTAGVDQSGSVRRMVWEFYVVLPNGGTQYVKMQCNAIPVYTTNDEGERVLATYANPVDGMELSDMNFQVSIPEKSELFETTGILNQTGGTATVQDVNVEAGKMAIKFTNLTVGNANGVAYTFDGVVPFAYSFLEQPE